MSRRQALGLLGLLAFVGALSFSLVSGTAASGSALSHGPGGLFAARRYLEARGAEVHLLDRPLDEAAEPGVLVLAFPWQRLDPEQRFVGVTRHMQRGGAVLLAYTGDGLDVAEAIALRALSVRRRTLRGDAPLHPLRWRRFAAEEWSLAPQPGAPPTRLRVRAPRRAPEPTAAAEVLYRSDDGTPLAFREPRGRGQLVVVPVDALSNARLEEQGNADLLESLWHGLGPRWTFDEYHHGLTAPLAPGDTRRQRVVDLLLLHLALLYLLGVLAVARRFGPAWEEAPVSTGSAAALLLGLGGLHRRLGHHRDAAARMLERAREVDPRIRLQPGLEHEAEDAEGLVRVARAVARAQAGRGRDA
jgi:hypothetical protein